MFRHTQEKPHKCDKCGYVCISSGQLKVHKRTHTGEKPFKCNQCAYVSACLSNLQRHKKKHSTEERPFKCSECSKNYTQKAHLTRHALIHRAKDKINVQFEKNHKTKFFRHSVDMKTLLRHFRDQPGLITVVRSNFRLEMAEK